jgi:hypothetical protein
MDHIDISAGNRIDRPCLVLAIFKFVLFVRAERIRQPFADLLPENIGSVQGESSETATHNRSNGGRRPNRTSMGHARSQ